MQHVTLFTTFQLHMALSLNSITPLCLPTTLCTPFLVHLYTIIVPSMVEEGRRWRTCRGICSASHPLPRRLSAYWTGDAIVKTARAACEQRTITRFCNARHNLLGLAPLRHHTHHHTPQQPAPPLKVPLPQYQHQHARVAHNVDVAFGIAAWRLRVGQHGLHSRSAPKCSGRLPPDCC